jgi:hypothetical protein
MYMLIVVGWPYRLAYGEKPLVAGALVTRISLVFVHCDAMLKVIGVGNHR